MVSVFVPNKCTVRRCEKLKCKEWLNYEKLPLMSLLSHGMFTGHVWLHGKRDVGSK
jgi:hypothetical protein